MSRINPLWESKDTPYKAIFKQHGITAKAVGQIMGISYTHVLNLLCGVSRITPENRAKLDSMVEQLEAMNPELSEK